jgi:tumor protein p53-inducible protein 3
LGVDGTWVLYGSMGGLKLGGGAGDTLLPTLLRKRAKLVGTTLRNRSEEYKATLVARFTQEALPNFSGGGPGAFKPIIHGEFPLEEVGAAHTLMESNETIGKLVIRVTGEL